MIHAYNKVYLDGAMATMGELFELVSEQDLDSLFFEFINSGIAKEFGKATPRYINMPSLELYREITGKSPAIPPPISISRSKNYWAGYVLAYYQWYSGKSFEEISILLPPSKVITMYSPLHEADINKFLDIAKMLSSSETSLAKLRKGAGISQSKLSRLSGVSLRSIQLYEQRTKDINKAQGDNIYKLAQVFGCNMEDLLEKN